MTYTPANSYQYAASIIGVISMPTSHATSASPPDQPGTKRPRDPRRNESESTKANAGGAAEGRDTCDRAPSRLAAGGGERDPDRGWQESDAQGNGATYRALESLHCPSQSGSSRPERRTIGSPARPTQLCDGLNPLP
jgi:hypothetical protein